MGEKELDKVVGSAFEELNAEDMQQTQGAGDVDPEILPSIVTPMYNPVQVSPAALSIQVVTK
ncbi:MAG: lichenicidin A2 family type 2 lantibiotic [Butyrivibrio sp.]|nr:lichenicidin A2 family type 2 lantibiotic [Butyrivibrio sp.]